MKKFLFTLATLIAAGFAANATAPVLAFETQEIELGTGETQEIGIKVATMGDEIVRGFQFQLAVFDSKHELINEAVIIKKAYSRNRLWFEPTAFGNYNQGNSLGQSNPLTDCYRFLGSNSSFNEVLYPEDAQDFQLTKFTVEVPGEWNDEFATVEMYSTPDYVNKWSLVSGGHVVEDGSEEAAGLILKINNKNAGTTTTPLTGTVVIGDNDGYEVPVTVNVNGTYDLVVTVAKDGGDAVEVPVTDGKIVLGQTPDYGTYVINATATGNGDYEGTVTAEEKTITIDQLKKDDPTITFTTAEDGTVTINVANATRYEVKVDGEAYDGMEVAPIYDATQTIEVEAWNEEQGYIAGHATATTTVAEKAYAAAVNPVIEFVPGETGVTINVDPFTSYEVIVDGENMGQINFVEKTWEPQHIVVNAVNEPAHQLKGEATAEYDLAAKANMDLTGTLTIGAVEEDGRIYVSYVGEEEIANIVVTINESRATQTIPGNAGYVQLDEKNVMYDVTATANAAAEHYNPMVAGPVQRIWSESVYTTPAPGVQTQETEDAYIITATGEGTVTLNVTVYDNNGVAHTETVTGQGTATYTVQKTDYIQYVDYSAYAQRDADANISEATSDSYIEVPAAVVTATPNIVTIEEFLWHTSELNNTAYSVGIECDDADAVIYYRINGNDWMVYTGKFILHGQDNEEFVVETYAKAPGKVASEFDTKTFVITNIPTSIDEIMSAENVANVRYFNVAGQEMQEANGLTIVVVTYTDGKTMTTKIMK